MKIITIIFLLFVADIAWTQAISDDISPDAILRNEFNTTDTGEIDQSSYLYPHVVNRSNRMVYNFLSGKNLRIEPVMGIRWSSAGFEMDPMSTPAPVLWVSPGIKFSASTYLFDPMLNLWLYAWGRFHKHSAYGFNGSPVISDQTLFPYRPEYSLEYYSRTESPENGIDLDESLGGVALVAPKFHLIWGKFRNHMGPSSRSNLHLSRTTPAYSQFRLVVNPNKRVSLTYMIGQLGSDIPDSSLYQQVYEDDLDETVKMSSISRYVAMHRMDFLNPSRTLRLGLWEQVIFGGRSIPFEYLNPITLFWSAQHKLGDVDNVQMGADWEWMIRDQRLYGALLMDEWAPYDTFKGSREHNWFGWQAGSSRIVRYNSLSMMFTLEYTYMDPRVSLHRFPVNDPQHHNYDIGYWTGGHADDWWFSVTMFPSHDLSGRFYWTTIRKGEQNREDIYENQSIQWMTGEIQKKQETGLDFWFWDSHQIQYTLNIRWMETQNLYPEDHFFDISIGALYNIHR
ncbi:MAG: hypothetical protein HQ510_05280 [Candidatus Marinimicrobia bacterium]|nr:hypothetical protein [Candidatus Neomarinimicrobiota bacterium]